MNRKTTSEKPIIYDGKLNKLIEGLDPIELAEKENSAHPKKYTKWTKEIDALPDKERKEYMNGAYDKAKQERKTKTEDKEQLLQTLPYPQSDLKWTQAGEDLNIKEIEKLNNNGIIREEVETVFFSFKEAHKKPKDLKYFDFCNFSVQDRPTYQNLYYPEEVPIDYSEYSDVPLFKNNIFAKSYKDGIMLLSDIERGNMKSIALTVGHSKKATFSMGKIVASIFENSYYHHAQIDWSDKKFDEQVVFYVVIPKIIKYKAARIVFKNNKNLNSLIKIFRQSKISSPLKLDEFKHFFDEAAESQHVMLQLLQGRENSKLKSQINLSNTILFRTGYTRTLRECFNIHLMYSAEVDQKNLFFENLQTKISLEDIKKEYLKDIFPYEQHLDISFLTKAKDLVGKHATRLIRKNFLKASLLYHHTNQGITFCNNTPIEIENKSKVDCLLFWKKIDLFELLFDVLNKKNFPLSLEDSKIINDVDIFDSILDKHTEIAYDIFDPKSYIHEPKGIKEFNFKNKHILEEAINNSTGYLVPYDGVFELLHDPLFKCIRFREYGDMVTAVILDKNERYIVEVFSKTEVDFKYMFWNRVKYDKNYSEECMQEVYTKIATVIRDCYVLIERDRTMGYGGKRRPYGMNTDSEYNIYYFPRKRYRRRDNTKAEKDFFRETRKFNGTRMAHIRKLPGNYAPSKKQLLLAKSLDRWVPDGHTFVKETDWGIKMTKREIRYRNTCLNDVFFYNNEEISEAKKIDQLSPAGFEEYCQEYVKKLGYSTKSRQNYDGGIDIRATKILDNNETEYALIQCKHWNTPIPPGEMRDFKTACDEEQSEYKKVKIFMTSSRFSPGAKELAERFDIKLVEGDDLIK